MEKNPLISIIIPIYNVEKYLKKCIESILNQTYKKTEIILIDDGSTDQCGKICDEYALLDSRIKVIHKKNGGLSDARNAGLDIMSGEFVTCVDSDDYVSSYYIENLITAIMIGEADISVSWFENYYEGNIVKEAHLVSEKDIQVLDKKEYYKRVLYQDNAEVSAWGKLYKCSLFDCVRYPIGKVYEDVATIYKIVDQVDSIAVIPNVDYYYLQRENSIAQADFSLRKMDAIEHMKDFMSYIECNYPELNRAAICRYFSVLCNTIFLINNSDFEEQKVFIWGEIKKYRRDVLFNCSARKKSRVAALLSYLGFDLMKMIYRIVKE